MRITTHTTVSTGYYPFYLLYGHQPRLPVDLIFGLVEECEGVTHRGFAYQSVTFTFTHLADAFIQSDLHCIQVTVSTFDQLLLSLGIEPMILALLMPCSTS